MAHEAVRHRLGLITAAYAGIRSDRQQEYYHRPLLDFVRAYRESGGQGKLIVHANAPSWSLCPELRSLVDLANVDEPEHHVSAIWNTEDWSSRYQLLLNRNPTHSNSYQAVYPRLIAVYLTKLRLVEIAFEQNDFDIILWHDAGHWISHGAQHDLGCYDSRVARRTNGERLDSLLFEYSSTHGVFGTLSRPNRKRFHMPLEWMREHAVLVGTQDPDALLRSLYTAVLWVFRRTSFPRFIDGFRRSWGRLIERGQAGIEENALTLVAWEQCVPGLDYAAWSKLLAGESVDSSFVLPGQRKDDGHGIA